MLAKLIDFAPALAFFITYRMTGDLILATIVIVAGCSMSFAMQYLIWRKRSRMQMFMIAMVLIFGLPTVLLDNPDIIKLKATVVNLIISTLLFVCQFVLKRNPLAYLLGQEVPLPDHIWFKIGTCFMIFFVFAAGLNVVIAFYLPDLFGIDAKAAESWWVDYKTFGSTILNCLFTLCCFIYMYRKYPEIKVALGAVEQLKGRRGASAEGADGTGGRGQDV